MRSRPSRRRSASAGSRRGAAAVEFAVIAPLFCLLLAGIVELGQAFRTEHLLSNASRRGVRAAVVSDATTAEVQQKVKTQCAQSWGVNEADVTVVIAVNGNVDVDLSQAEEGDEISLSVSIPYSKAAVGFFANMFSNSVLSSTCTLEHE